MSDTLLDELAEGARNRGLKLVRSRIRTPTKRRFGKVGLTDAGGKAVFGMDSKGPAANPEEVERYLRALSTKDWGASLEGSSKGTKTSRGKPRPRAKAATLEAAPKPPPQRRKPSPEIREAKLADAQPIAGLVRSLGHEIDEKSVRKNLRLLQKSGETPLVATIDNRVVGLCGISIRTVIGRVAPLGRLTSLVVAEGAQGLGIGRMLVEEAERRMRKAGCKLVEATSNDRRNEAHAFYRHLGFERTSIRFAKAL